MYIGVYRSKYPVYSEVFITEQVSSYRNRSCVICRDKLNVDGIDPNISVFSTITGFWSKLIFTLFGRVSKDLQDKFSEVDLLHAHFGQDGYYAMNIAKKLGIPFVVTYHGQDCTVNGWQKIKSLQISNILYVINRKRIFKSAAKIIAVSDFVKSELIKQGCKPEKIAVHYIGVDIDRFSFIPPEEKISNEPVRILCVGRHTEKKGLEYLLKALSLCKSDFVLTQIGRGELTSQLESWISLYGLQKKVKLMGPVSSEKVNEQMKMSDIFVLPSVRARNGDSEAFGIVFIEASAVGVPVVSTRHGGIPEAVQEDVSGLLVDERDPIGLAEALDRLIQDRELRDSLGTNGRRMVEEQFDIKKRTEKLEKLYFDIIRLRDKE